MLSNTAIRSQLLKRCRQILLQQEKSMCSVLSAPKGLNISNVRTFSNRNCVKRYRFLGGISPSLWLKRNASAAVTQKEDGYLLINNGTREVELPYIWLRDHCRCEKCYNHTTSQKNVDSYSLSLDIAPTSVNLQGQEVKLEWPDGHQTKYDIDWLIEHSFSSVSKLKTPFFLWDKKKMLQETLPVVSYENYCDASQEGLKKTLSNLLSYGFSIIEGVDASIKGTQSAVEKIAFLQETVFGQMWSFTSDLQRSDTAYTNLFLGAHTDTTYFNLPAGIQVFHCLWHDGKGGDTLLVDGFHAAEQFRQNHPDDFDFLTKAVVPHEYKEWGTNHILSHGTILRVQPGSGEMMHIRYNPYDMAPIDTIPPREIPHFYSAYSRLGSYIGNSDNEYWLKLHPGMVLLVNNWRVLHGRASFTGRRVICGCYLPRDDWMNKARVFNLV